MFPVRITAAAVGAAVHLLGMRFSMVDGQSGQAMKTKIATIGNKDQRDRKRYSYPEMYVGFPERNDASRPDDAEDRPTPNEEMERVHVDPETLDISRKNAGEVHREIAEQDPAGKKSSDAKNDEKKKKV